MSESLDGTVTLTEKQKKKARGKDIIVVVRRTRGEFTGWLEKVREGGPREPIGEKATGESVAKVVASLGRRNFLKIGLSHEFSPYSDEQLADVILDVGAMHHVGGHDIEK